ncbi:MAG: sulfate adenylyltransferase subunit 2 [Flavobacteriales bacterium]|jgi:sulfate adenylyltransferase subunit 2|uniref:sulfate adenylyltransferase subunit CysD n=1 Tax=Blattabacterium sp. (Mastotermes darwiniensis) TaxID=39768 RepID=UPI000231DE4E|nr:sulfate adenylyltransferase subunit CysD [Blattabacterium sp. (Mastotermes darwiniensis)]AER40642.1 sulfate adenylyltransferase subunit 2 [Blattabacterium sp. (Mastotermes darwiniensis) str. MADAR]MDR1804830.1 sulfate adenylyltransferase subunit 2 [Flavobacteriales bacterium]
MKNYRLNYLEQLESETIHIYRETAGQFDRPALLFSGGKDSVLLVHLALKAFKPGEFPFTLVHIDTGYNFPETLEFRDFFVKKIREKIIIRKVEDTILRRNLSEPKGRFPNRNILQSYTLIDTIEEFQFDACIGGGRRDEEKARSKERIFSIRNEFGSWEPRLQRPELWNIYNGKIHKGENMRVFPISNWTELDVWNYIQKEKILLPSIYFSHKRKVINFQGKWIALSKLIKANPNELVHIKNLRYRTIGDMTCTAAIESNAKNVEEIIQELLDTKISERGQTRIDDTLSETSMEDRKKQGYF